MKRSRFSEEQITYALRQHEAGTPAAEKRKVWDIHPIDSSWSRR